MDRIIDFAKNIDKDILYIKNILHYDVILHIGLIIFTAVASAHTHTSYYEEGKMPGINRIWAVCIFIVFYAVAMLIDWAKKK
jgi:hypothetical protein